MIGLRFRDPRTTSRSSRSACRAACSSATTRPQIHTRRRRQARAREERSYDNIEPRRLCGYVASIGLSFFVPWQASLLMAQGATSADSSQTYVAVSRHEMRVFFAPDTSRAWGWSAPSDTTRRRSYSWSVTVEGLDGPRSLSLQVERRDNRARTFPSLETLVRAGTTRFCQPGMMVQCFDATVTATVQNRRVVLTYRDSSAIARMFGQRPASVTTLEDAPAMRAPYRLGQAPVRYVDPQLPQLDSAGRRSAALARRAYEASVNLVRRRISVETGGGALSLAVGDSAQLGVEEWHCLEDSCTPFHDRTNAPRDWGRWSLTDTSVARLYRLGRRAKNWRFAADSERVMTLVALKPGRTIVRAVGVHTAADSVPSRQPVDSVLQMEVLVTPAIRRSQGP